MTCVQTMEAGGMTGLDAVAARLGARDLLLFHHTHGRSHLLVGGTGMGRHWAGTVAVEERDEPRLVAAVEGQIVRVRQPSPTKVIGPYYSSSAVMIALDDAVLVAGGEDLLGLDDDTLRTAALDVCDLLVSEEPTRDLLRELGLYERIGGLLTPEADRLSTAHHLAGEVAELLEADFVLVLPEPGADLAVAKRGWSPRHSEDLRAVADQIVGALPDEVLVIQDARDAPMPSPFAPSDGIVSAMILPLTSQGFVLAVHTTNDPRGFTSLDTDVATLIAEAGSVSLAAADTATTLSRHAERVRWLLRRDPVTGLPDRHAWEGALEATAAGAVISIGMGHGSHSDHLLQVMGAVLQRQATDTDLVARVSPDEFGLLLRGADLSTARRVASIIHKRLGPIQRSDGSPLSIGVAASPPSDTVDDAWRVAAGRMLSG